MVVRLQEQFLLLSFAITIEPSSLVDRQHTHLLCIPLNCPDLTGTPWYYRSHSGF